MASVLPVSIKDFSTRLSVYARHRKNVRLRISFSQMAVANLKASPFQEESTVWPCVLYFNYTAIKKDGQRTSSAIPLIIEFDPRVSKRQELSANGPRKWVRLLSCTQLS